MFSPASPSIFPNSISCNNNRHAPRRPGDLPRYASPQAGDDVLRHTVKGHSFNLQKIYAECECTVNAFPAFLLTHLPKPLEIYVDDETKLTLHGLQQYYLKLEEKEKNRKLNDLLDNLEFNQVPALGKSALSSSLMRPLRFASSSNPWLVRHSSTRCCRSATSHQYVFTLVSLSLNGEYLHHVCAWHLGLGHSENALTDFAESPVFNSSRRLRSASSSLRTFSAEGLMSNE